jgi:twitching motility protein PilT
MSSLHTTDVVQTIQRIISFYPPHQHDEVRLSIASNVAAVISQRLIPRADGKGRVPAIEVMVSTPTLREFIMNPEKIPLIHGIIAEGMTEYGMQTFDQSVLTAARGLITEQTRSRTATSRTSCSSSRASRRRRTAPGRRWKPAREPASQLGAEPTRPPRTSGELGTTRIAPKLASNARASATPEPDARATARASRFRAAAFVARSVPVKMRGPCSARS